MCFPLLLEVENRTLCNSIADNNIGYVMPSLVHLLRKLTRQKNVGVIMVVAIVVIVSRIACAMKSVSKESTQSL